jgi:fibronectin-binding autotransporter adhesin
MVFRGSAFAAIRVKVTGDVRVGTLLRSGRLAGMSMLALVATASLSFAEIIDAGTTFTVPDGGFIVLGSFEDGPGGGGTVVIGPTDPFTQLDIGTDNRNVFFSGAITGAGSLMKTGTGLQVLTGTSNIGGSLTLCGCFEGAMEIRGGSFTVGSGVVVDLGQLSVTQGGRLDQLDAFGFAGIFVGDRMLVDGSGTVVNDAGVTVVGGFVDTSLVISNGAVFNTAGGAALGTPIARTDVIVTGAGSAWNVKNLLILQAAGSPTVLTVADGAAVNVTDLTPPGIVFGPGTVLNLGTGGLAGAFNAPRMFFDGEIVANFTDVLTLAADLDGFGTLTKNGPGRLILTGANTYLGETTVNGGILSVNGQNGDSPFLINPAGTLGGTGLAGQTMLAGGTIDPGNSVGTLTVNDSLTFGAGSTYRVEVSTTADRINVVAGGIGPGNAVLTGGTVAPVYLPGGLLQRQYVILNAAGGLGGTSFAGLATAAPGIVASLTYDASNVYLNHTISFGTIPGLTQNQRNVAAALDNHFTTTGTLPTDFALLTAADLTLASGELSTAAINAGIVQTDLFLDLISGADAGPNAGADPLAFASEGTAKANAFEAALGKSSAHNADPAGVVTAERWRAWGGVYGGAANIGGDATVIGSQDLSTSTFGLASGIARRWADGSAGIALGGAWSRFSLDNGMGSGRTGAFNAGLHGSQAFGPFYVGGALAYTFHDISTRRIAGGGLVTASFGAHSFSGRAEAGYRIVAGLGTISPYAAFQAINTNLPAYSETGGGILALNYAAASTTATRAELGARFEHVTALESGTQLRLTARAAWGINGGTARAAVAAFQALGGTSFVVDGASPDRHSALVDAGIELSFSERHSASLMLRGEFSENVSSFGAKARYSFKW